jgi:aubergine-like protein
MSLQRYSISFSPEISFSLLKEREKVAIRARPQIIEHIGKYVFANTVLFSTQTSQEFSVSAEKDGVSYTLTITPSGEITSAQETKHFYNKFFNSVQGMLKLVMIGRKFYNPEASFELLQHSIKIWPGYATSVGYYEEGCLLNIDISHRCLRTITVYEQILEIKKKNPHEFKQNVARLLVNGTVLTLYNKKSYKIEDVDWDKSPLSLFEKEGTNVEFKDYYCTRWGTVVSHNEQPLLKASVKNFVCYLIPELCVLTGLTDELRSDFNIMRDLAQATKKDPKQRLVESSELIKTILTFPKSREETEKWQIDISTQAISLTGRVLPAGKISMGDQNSFKINEATGNFDRDIQQKMFNQPKIDKWGIFYTESDKQLVERSLLTNLVQVVKTFQFACEKPAMFGVSSERWSDWDRVLRSTLNPTVKFIICVLPGSRGKSRLYDDLKRLTFTTFPVPNQVILSATLKKEKGLRSVINKVIIQINAKVGGIPWALDQLPFKSEICMVVGIDMFKKQGDFSVLGYCATMDSTFGKYGSFPKIINRPGDELTRIKECTEQALEQFKADNKVYPSVIVVFRDGVSDSQRVSVLVEETATVKQAFSAMRNLNPVFKEPKLIYMLVNKRTNARFYQDSAGNVANPPLGTLVDTKVVQSNAYEFYLLPAKANQGSMTPTHFFVIYDDSGLPCDEVQNLAYRMCYSYYNWSGSIRVPAPCQYAHKLAYNYGERSDRNGPPQPHTYWNGSRSLYFL